MYVDDSLPSDTQQVKWKYHIWCHSLRGICLDCVCQMLSPGAVCLLQQYWELVACPLNALLIYIYPPLALAPPGLLLSSHGRCSSWTIPCRPTPRSCYGRPLSSCVLAEGVPCLVCCTILPPCRSTPCSAGWSSTWPWWGGEPPCRSASTPWSSPLHPGPCHNTPVVEAHEDHC